MIRYALLVIFVTIVIGISFRNWFRALCVMLPMLAFLERPDMPREMLGIGGLNAFNISMAFILMGWFWQRKHEQLEWKVDTGTNKLLLIYFAILAVSMTRALLDPSGIAEFSLMVGGKPPSVSSLVKDGIINCLKWVLPGLLICHGANTEARKRMAMMAVLATGFLLCLQVISKMAPALVGSDDLATRALRVLDRDIGYHRVDVAAISAGTAWAFYACRFSIQHKFASMICWGGFAVCSLSMILTGGRAGLLGWLACGATIAFIRARSLIFLMPLVGLLALAVVPGLKERVFEGFSEDSHEESVARRGIDTVDDQGRDRYAITSGRIVVWPLVIDKAAESPIIGHGRYAMKRKRISQTLVTEFGITQFGHPHNAYLEILVDTGIIGLGICLMFFGRLGLRCFRVTAAGEPGVDSGIAGMCLAFLTVQAVAAIGSQSFYPQQSATLLWVVMGLAMCALPPSVRVAKQNRTNMRQVSLPNAGS